ncbi:MAG: GntR family transcriptional regulator [Firmicutes bacterium]|nr:GntR family transcriptional regulator [Bacillota bacterium]
MKNETSLKDTIYSAILDDILALEYLPGQILNEKDMIEKFSCSKAPVREALQALCIDGVLRSIPRYGYEVVRLTMDDIREMLQFRIVLESGMIRARGTKLTPAQLDRLDEIDKLCTEAADDPWTHWAYNTEFHLKLITFCGNSYAVEQLSRCMTRLRRGYAQMCVNKLTAEPEVDTRHHQPLLKALREKDIESALIALRADLNDFAGMNTGLLADEFK